MLRGPFPVFADFEDAMNGLLNNDRDSKQYFVILAAAEAGGERIPMGMLSLIEIKPSYRSLEIGNVIYAPALQRTAAATEANWLLMRHAFGLGYRRVVWKCNDLNEASKRAALRLGFEYEGVSKCHMVVRGRNRDTAWYAMVEEGWPLARRALEEWLAEGNFDGKGRQRVKLEEVRRRVAQ
jgi:RimJ/RimL family protein N-acetyltransferase